MRGEGGRKEVAQLAWPLAVGMLSFTVMGVTDMILMGRVGTEAQAGVGLGVTLVFLVAAFFRGVTSGAQSLWPLPTVPATFAGSCRRRVLLLIGLRLVFLGGRGVGLGSLGLEITDDAGVCAAELHAHPLRHYSIDGVIWIMSVLQGSDTRIRMWASIAGNATNVVLDFVFIFGLGPIPAMGAAGAALATVAGILVMLVMYAWRFKRVVGRPERPTQEVLRSTIAIGLPAGAQAGLGTLAFSTMTIILAKVGTAHLAASQIALNVISVSFLPGYGLGEAAGVLAGRYVGAEKPRLRRGVVRP